MWRAINAKYGVLSAIPLYPLDSDVTLALTIMATCQKWGRKMMYTIKQIADIAHITVRTLHHYDSIGLFTPTEIGDNGYRYYDEDALLCLQQILFYRELGLELAQIRDILHSDDFNPADALQSHKKNIQDKMTHLAHLLETIDETLDHLEGKNNMSKKKMFSPFDEEQQREYEREARLQYDPETVAESHRRWNSYNKEEQATIMDEGNQIYDDLTALLTSGKSPNNEAVQATLIQWHQHIRYFYEPTLDILRGLGELYVDDARFAVKFQALHPDLPTFLKDGIAHYVDVLETQAIERLLADDNELMES